MKRRTLLQAFGGGLIAASLPRPAMAGGRVKVGAVPGTVPAPGASLNVGWRFHPGEIEPKPLRGQSASYVAAKAGGARGAAAPNHDDASWRTVDLPHDWAIEAPPVQTENIAQGYRKRGIAWYRRAITLDRSLEGRYLEIQFGAIATNATLWFNGTPVEHNWSGYNGFSIDITSMATFGETNNMLAIRVDADAAEGWWYEGAGIYRDVWLVDRAPVSIVTDGVHADPRRQTSGEWRIPVEVTLYSIEREPRSAEIMVDLLDADGSVVASARGQGTALPLERSIIQTEIGGIRPKLWSVEMPNLYSVRTRLLRDGKVVDERTTPCGFRTIRFDAERGFFLNEAPLKLKGVCLHQDHAGVGVAVPAAIVEWRVRQLKAMGCNAIRCSHGAPDPALLHVCDRLGMLVMDENRNFNVSPDYIEQLEWLVRRDRNHPSVILWSVFNEEPFQGTTVGFEMVRRATARVKSLDDTRPVTAAMNSGMFTPVNVSQAVDVIGFNYQHASYDRFHKENPHLPMLSSEDTSAFMTRGEWRTDKTRQIRSSDDSEAAGWGLTQRKAWRAIDTRPYLAGGFVWTGLDYHGEPTPGSWPANSSYFGILDLCGFPKSAFFIRRALWVKDRPLIDILPHWNWDGRDGEMVAVMVATNLERVELRLNGKPVGSGTPDPYDMISFDVPYRPGTLEAVGWKDGRIAATSKVETTGSPIRLRLTPDRAALAGDGVDAQPVRIEAVDAKGRPVPTANLAVELSISGGRIIGVGNGNPVSLAPSKGNQVQLFNGLAQAIVQTMRGGTGRMTLTAASPGLRPALATVTVVPGAIRQALPPSLRQAVSGWRQSPVLVERPRAIPELADNDMNSWDPIIAGERPAPAAGDGFVILAARIDLGDAMASQGAHLKFSGIMGSGEVMLDGEVVARKPDKTPGPLVVPIAAGRRQVTAALILRAIGGEPAGLSGPVFVEP
ncbi:beta-galactosidase [Sphingomonas sp. DBB INV C78]|uniref:beta-galactosidase GalA n=1 Tax=Sphingomonas sp. DBB INV C78 TaxID=3349434 RepID=UPI0036D2B3C8